MNRVHVFGDDINTDYIISSQRKRDTVDPFKLARWLMEDIRPGFGELVQPGDFLAAGNNFGCGSAMEIAPMVIKAAGVGAVIARSFARSFFRNAVNIGLPLIQAETGGMKDGDILDLDREGAVVNVSTGETMPSRPWPPLIREIIQTGGIIEYMAERQGQD